MCLADHKYLWIGSLAFTYGDAPLMAVLDPTVAEGRKLPKWSPCSRQRVFVGYDSNFASSVGLILNKEKRTIAYTSIPCRL